MPKTKVKFEKNASTFGANHEFLYSLNGYLLVLNLGSVA
jgi:hypothetical protein